MSTRCLREDAEVAERHGHGALVADGAGDRKTLLLVHLRSGHVSLIERTEKRGV